MGRFIVVVSLNCGRYDKKINIDGKTPEEVQVTYKKVLAFTDKRKYFVIITDLK